MEENGYIPSLFNVSPWRAEESLQISCLFPMVEKNRGKTMYFEYDTLFSATN
jgi:hypothetical protein